ncbi:MAG: hypothetical protein IJX38_05555 [Clostridia bacterium]|nr:hypothetical protein [Clostridia bacterium]
MKKTVSILILLAITILSFGLTSCGVNESPEEAERALRNEGYEVSVSHIGDTTYISATRSDGNFVSATYYPTADEADGVWNVLEEGMEERLVEYAEKYNLRERDFRYGKDGRAIYFGTKDAVRAAR